MNAAAPDWRDEPTRPIDPASFAAPQPAFVPPSTPPELLYGVAPRPLTAAWPWWQRVAFRYLCLHGVLYGLPDLVRSLAQTLASLVARFVGDDTAGAWAWPGVAAGAIGKVESWWESLTSAVGTRFGLDVVHQGTGSGDTLHDHLKLACIVAAALLGTAIWSLLARRSAYPRLGRFVHLAARWWLAFWLIVYGSIKLYGGQFGTPGLGRLSEEVGDMSPMGMVWTFLGASKPYEIFAGLGELLGGLLLFHRRTALLGSCVAIAVMANVVALNWLYDVPVKLFSSHLLLCALCLLAPWGARLWGVLVTNRATEPVDLRVVRRPWLGWLLAIAGALWVAATLVATHFDNRDGMAQMAERFAKPALYGIWTVDEMKRDGEVVPDTDATRWRFLAIDAGGRAWARAANGQQVWLDYTEDLAAGTITLAPSMPAGIAAAPPAVWAVELGTKTVQVAVPEPQVLADFGRTVPVVRSTLALRGVWDGKLLELSTVERVFRLDRGFHFVQELPFNR